MFACYFTSKREEEVFMTAYNQHQGNDSTTISICYKLASMVAFQYRNRYLGHRHRRVSFTDFTAEDEYFYKKRDVIYEIQTRNERDAWYDPLLLKSEMWNLDEALQDARTYYVKMSKMILTYTHLNDDEIQDCLDEMMEVIDDWKERIKREVAKREGKFEKYREQLEIEWENECWQAYINQRQY
jgi:gas vesicle protein